MQTGNFILAQASRALALQGNPYVIDLLTNVIEDLVRGTRHCYIDFYIIIIITINIIGEVMQLHTDDTETLFDKYLEKSFKKTASLMAHSCQAVGCWFFFFFLLFFFFDILLF